MALTVTAAVGDLSRAWSEGPIKKQLINFTIASGDTSGTITASSLQRVDFVQVSGLVSTAAPTFSTNVVTLTFADPAATVYCQAIVYGR